MPGAGRRDQDAPETGVGGDSATVGVAQADERVLAGQDQPVGIEGHRISRVGVAPPELNGRTTPRAIGASGYCARRLRAVRVSVLHDTAVPFSAAAPGRS